jgi:PAS domain S-box-containing protein
MAAMFRLPSPWRLYFLLALTQVILAALIVYGYLLENRVHAVDLPFLSALRKTTLEAVATHLRIEDVLEDRQDRRHDQPLWDGLDQSVSDLRSLIHPPLIIGREVETELYPALHFQITALESQLSSWKVLFAGSMDRVATLTSLLQPKEFADVHSEFTRILFEIEDIIEEDAEKKQDRFRTVQASLAGLWLAFAICVAAGIRRYERQKAESFAMLERRNIELRNLIEERKNAERILTERENLLRTIYDSSPVSIIISRLTDAQVIDINQAFAALTGYARQALIGKKISEMPVWENPAIPDELLGRLVQAETTLNLQSQLRVSDGTQRVVLVSSTRLELNGEMHLLIAARDISELKAAEEALKSSHEKLEWRVRERTEQLTAVNERLKAEVQERALTERSLMQHQLQLRKLSSTLIQTEERERHRISTAIHDGIGQTLAAAKIKLGALRAILPSGVTAKQLDDVRDLISMAIEETRSLTFELSPPVLYEIGLLAALEWMAERFHRKFGLPITINGDGSEPQLNIPHRVFIFRAVRELCFNAVKHARASQVIVSIQEQGEFLSCDVTDDGAGFDTKQGRKANGEMSFGLFSLREQLRHYGGSLALESEPGSGTRVVLRLPLKPMVQSNGDMGHHTSDLN